MALETLALVYLGAEVVGPNSGGLRGMLERFCRHLECGGWGILRKRRPRRMPHYTIWVHGSDGIDPMTSLPVGGALACEVDSFQRRAAGEPLYLSFLYPSKTLAFFKRQPHHGLQCRALQSNPSNQHQNHCKRHYSYTTLDNTPPETPHSNSDRYSNLRNLLNGEPGLYDEAWRHYTNESDILPRHINRLMGYLRHSGRKEDQLRVIQLAGTLQNGQYDSEGCDSLVQVYLDKGLLNEAYKLLCTQADLNALVTIRGAIRFVAYHIDHGSWGMAVKGFGILCRADIGVISAEKVAAEVDDFSNKYLHWLQEKPVDSYTQEFAIWLGNGGIANSASRNNAESALDAFQILRGLHLEGFGAKIRLKNVLDTMRQLQEHKLYQPAAEAYLIYRDTPLTEAPTAFQLSSLLNGTLVAFGQLGDFRNMERVFDDWFHFGSRPNEESCLFIMRQFALRGETTVVKEFYDYYEKRFPLRVEAIETVMHAHTIRGEVREVERWFDKLSNLELQPTRVTYNILLNAYKEADDISSALKCFHRMFKLPPEDWPDLITYQTILSLCANRGDLTSVKVLLEAMKEQKIPINQSIHNAVTRAHAKQKDVTSANEAFDIAKQVTLSKLKQPLKEKFHDVDPSRMWNNILVGYIWAGDLNGLATAYHHMRQNEIPFDSYTYSILLHYLCMSGKLRQAEQMFDILEEEKAVKLNQAHYATLMLDAMIRKDITKVWSAYNRMLKAGLTPTFITQAILIQAVTTAEYREYRKSGGVLFLPEAEAILSQSTSDLSILDLTSPDNVKSATPPFLFIPLLQVYAREGSSERMLELFERFTMIQQRQEPGGTKPSLRMYLYVMNGLLRTGDMELLLDLWKRSKSLAIYQARQGVRPNESSKWILQSNSKLLCQIFSVVVRAFSLRGLPADVIWEMDHLSYHGFVLDNMNINDVVQALVVNGMIKKAFELCESQLIAGTLASKKHRRGEYAERPQFYTYMRTLESLITEVKAFQLAEGEYRGLKLKRRNKILKDIEARYPNTWAELNELKDVEHSVAKETIHWQEKRRLAASGSHLKGLLHRDDKSSDTTQDVINQFLSMDTLLGKRPVHGNAETSGSIHDPNLEFEDSQFQSPQFTTTHDLPLPPAPPLSPPPPALPSTENTMSTNSSTPPGTPIPSHKAEED